MKKISTRVIVPVPVLKPWVWKSAAVIAQAQEKMQKAEVAADGVVQSR